MDGAEVAGKPEGRCSKAFCSSIVAGSEGERLDTEGLLGEPSTRFFGLPRSMIEEPPSDSCRRWPWVSLSGKCRWGASDCPREWPEIMGLGAAEGAVGVTEREGLGDERPSWPEMGVIETEVDAVEVDRRLVVEADIGVYGEARGYGELSGILADFGGTPGGVLPDRRRVAEVCWMRR